MYIAPILSLYTFKNEDVTEALPKKKKDKLENHSPISCKDSTLPPIQCRYIKIKVILERSTN